MRHRTDCRRTREHTSRVSIDTLIQRLPGFRADPFAGCPTTSTLASRRSSSSSKTPRTAAQHAPFAGGDASLDGLPSSAGFVALLAAYRATGGAVRGCGLDRLLGEHTRGNFGSLAGLIASGDVFGFEWRGALWIPMFQFDLTNLSIRRAPQRARAELPVAFDGWAQAAWFARRNVWLYDRRPADLADAELAALQDAARADRFMAAA